MSLPVVYRRKVGRDLAAGYGHCEGQSPGLGERLLIAVDSVFDAIAFTAMVRRAVVARFPYAAFYRIESRRVVVLTVLHTARVRSSGLDREGLRVDGAAHPDARPMTCFIGCRCSRAAHGGRQPSRGSLSVNAR